jgi:hypothetical protein
LGLGLPYDAEACQVLKQPTLSFRITIGSNQDSSRRSHVSSLHGNTPDSVSYARPIKTNNLFNEKTRSGFFFKLFQKFLLREL